MAWLTKHVHFSLETDKLTNVQESRSDLTHNYASFPVCIRVYIIYNDDLVYLNPLLIPNRRLYYSLHSHGIVARSSTQLIDHYFIFFSFADNTAYMQWKYSLTLEEKWKKNAADRDMDIFGLCTDGVYSVWWRQNTSPGKHSSAWFSNFLQRKKKADLWNPLQPVV